MDEWGNWHVSFYLQDQVDGNLIVKGFDPTTSPTEQFIPEWIKYDANLWSQGLLSDEEFLTGIISMVNYRVIEISMENNLKNSTDIIPYWIQNPVGWWSQGLISNEEFVTSMEFLVNDGILPIN